MESKINKDSVIESVKEVLHKGSYFVLIYDSFCFHRESTLNYTNL